MSICSLSQMIVCCVCSYVLLVMKLTTTTTIRYRPVQLGQDTGVALSAQRTLLDLLQMLELGRGRNVRRWRALRRWRGWTRAHGALLRWQGLTATTTKRWAEVVGNFSLH